MAPKVGTEAICGLAGVATGLGTNGDRFWTVRAILARSVAVPQT